MTGTTSTNDNVVSMKTIKIRGSKGWKSSGFSFTVTGRRATGNVEVTFVKDWPISGAVAHPGGP